MDSPLLDFPEDLVSTKSGGFVRGAVDTLSTPVVRFTPVSVSYVTKFWADVTNKVLSPDITLYRLRFRVEDVPEGSTGSLHDTEDDGNILVLYIPYRKSGFSNLIKVNKNNVVEVDRTIWTTEEVVEYVILPLMMEDETCIVDTIPKEDVGEPFEGYFITHARSCKFGDLVSAIRHYFVDNVEKNQQLDFTKIFVWIDVFCANQPMLGGKEFEPEVQLQRYKMLEQDLHLAIATFSERLVFFDNFTAPTPIGRAWCVWELYGVARNKLSMDVICTPETSISLAQKFTSGNLKVLDMLSGLNLKGMKCHSDDDLKRITKAVEELEGGFVLLKQTVTDTLRKWVLKFSTNLRKKRLRALNGKTNYSIDDGHLLYRTAVVLNDFSQNDLSIIYSNASIEIYEKVKQPLWVAFAWRELGKVYLNKRDAQKALDYHQKELAYYLKGLTPSMYGEKYYNLTVGAAYMSIGNAYDGLKNPHDAMKNYDLAFDAYVKAYTEKSLDAANVLICKGRVFQFLNDFKKAEECMLRAMKIKLELFGPDNVTMGYDYSNLAWLYINTGDWNKAHEFLFKSLYVRQEVLGEMHYLVALGYNHIAYCYRLEQRYDDSLEYYHKAVAVYDVILPGTSETADLYNNIGYVHLMKQQPELSNRYYLIALRLYEKLNMETRVREMKQVIAGNNAKLPVAKRSIV